MTQPSTDTHPLRVAIIGAGPTGFYTAEHLFRQKEIVVEVDMFERLPFPYGLVRGGVAPDHQKIKSVTKVFDNIAANPRFRFYGNVEFGRNITLADLRQHYHQIVFTTGAQTDRSLGIPGEALAGSYAATEFVAWYNGHPDYRTCQFDLSQERVAVIGVGNVAIDVARMLCRTPDELAQTDVPPEVIAALSHSQVKEVYVLGRRGPAQAAFTNPEIKELGELANADITALPNEVQLDSHSQDMLAYDRATQKKIEILQDYALKPCSGKKRRLVLRFLVSPVEVLGNSHVTGLRLVKNELYADSNGNLQARTTGQYEELPVGLVFRSVGYKGVALPDVPFDSQRGVIPNQQGRVIAPATGEPVVGEYTAGWIKRGPSGIIGTNKPDAAETAARMLADLAQGVILNPDQPTAAAVELLVRQRQPQYFSYADWLRLDEIEIARGQAVGRPRIKFTCVEDMLVALGR
jgi:ferredoxin/flavodoxin---NADP+ reductase